MDCKDTGKLTVFSSRELSNRISVVDQFLKPEAYLESLEAVNLKLIIEVRDQTSGTINFLKIEPNPVYSEAKIHFHLTEGGLTEIRFFDVSGRVLFIMEKDYEPGNHMEEIKTSNLPFEKGIVFCQMVSNGFTMVRKFVKLE